MKTSTLVTWPACGFAEAEDGVLGDGDSALDGALDEDGDGDGDGVWPAPAVLPPQAASRRSTATTRGAQSLDDNVFLSAEGRPSSQPAR
jgi:hypothetical protein